MPHLSPDLVRALHMALVGAGLADQRGALLGGVDLTLVASLPKGSTPAAQMLSDLHALNAMDTAESLLGVLANAAVLSPLLGESDALQRALALLRAPPAATRAVASGAPRERLLDGINQLPGDYHHRIAGFIDAYLGGADPHDVYCGRESDIAELCAWLTRADATSNLVVTAPAGRGKSALLVRLAVELAAREDLAVAFVPLSVRFETHLAGVFLRCLVARLAALHGRKVPDLRGTGDDELQSMLLDDLTRELPDGRLVVVILDGLDEAPHWRVRPRLFSPRGRKKATRVILSARHKPDDPHGEKWLRDLGWERPSDAAHVELPLLDLRDFEGVLARLPPPLDGLARRPEIVAELCRLCEGEPLTLWLMLDEMRLGPEAAALSVEDLRARRPGLGARFDEWWEVQRKLWGDQALPRERAVGALLNLLAVAERGLTRESILALMRDVFPDSLSLDEALHPLSRLVHGQGTARGYVPSHPGFAEHLRARLTEAERRQWRERIATWSRGIVEKLAGDPGSYGAVPRYVVETWAAQLRERGDRSPGTWMQMVTRAWYLAWQEHELGSSPYLEDVQEAWRMVAAADQGHAEAGEAMVHLADEARCALVRGSVGSVGNMEPALLKALLQEGLWSPEQALAYVRSAPIGDEHGEGREKLLKTLAPITPAALLPKLFEQVCALAGEPGSSWHALLEELLPRIAIDDSTAAIVAMRTISPSWQCAQLFATLAKHAPLSKRQLILREGCALARQNPHAWLRASALKTIAAELSEPERDEALREAFQAAMEIPDAEPYTRAHSFAALFEAMPEDLRSIAASEALRGAAQVSGRNRRYALGKVIEALPSPWREQAIGLFEEEIRATVDRTEAIKLRRALLVHLAAPERPPRVEAALDAVMEIADEKVRLEALGALQGDYEQPLRLPEVRKEIQAGALRVVHSILDPRRCLSMLFDFRRWLPLEDAQRLRERAWPAVENLLRHEAPLHFDSHMLIALRLRSVEDALVSARAARAAWLRVELLVDIARRLPPDAQAPIAEEALTAAEAVLTPRKRAELLLQVCNVIGPERQGEVLEAHWNAISQLTAPWQRCEHFTRFAAMLDDPWRTELLDEARASASEIPGPDGRIDHLLQIAEIEVDDRRAAVIEDAVQVAEQGLYPRFRPRTLLRIANFDVTRRHELLQAALEASREVDDGAARVATMTLYSAHLSLDEALLLADDIDALRQPTGRAEAHATLLEHCVLVREPLFERALAAARAANSEFIDAGTRATFLAKLLGVASAAARERLIRELFNVVQEDLASLERMPSSAFLEDEAAQYGDWRTSRIESRSADALARAAGYLSEEQLAEALEIASTIGALFSRATAMGAMAARLDEPRRTQIADALLAAEDHDGPRSDPAEWRPQLARQLAGLWPEPRRSQVLAAFPARSPEPPLLATDLPDTVFLERVEQGFALPAEPARDLSSLVVYLVARMPPERREAIVGQLIERVVPSLAPTPRAQLLVRLLPLVPDEWIDRCLDAAEAAQLSYPDTFSASAARLSAPQLDRLLQILEADRSSASPRDPRVAALAVLGAERLRRAEPPRAKLWQLVHTHLRAHSETRAAVLSALSDLAPLLVGLGGAEAAPGVVHAVRLVGAWWR